MAITIINSSSVKPRAPGFLFALTVLVPSTQLPVLILGAVERDAGRLGVNIENIVTVPGVGRGIVLHGTQSPLGIAGHGIYRNVAQELQLFAVDVHSVDERIQVGWVPLRPDFNLEGSPVG